MGSKIKQGVRIVGWGCAPLLLGAATALLFVGGPARADEQMVLVSKIDVGGVGLGAFDISFVDPKIDLYVLADRTNASVDLFDASTHYH
jgi:hypothetical protein